MVKMEASAKEKPHDACEETMHDKGSAEKKEDAEMDGQQNRAQDVHINRTRTNGCLERKPVSVPGSQ
ncbi:hypothetical protein [Oxalicibacterium solurbis]|uniref:Uncharacterized protein n=1 Tax=Oxalicibacterium solurbis TaxID=69280 RepID=A0A8J3B2V3_9BURK|nr:hypothetical protein [Oxalicibacterium solurbis]GGI54083.1 hypothetical protein GCM10011430_12570 [Oxalicibacterium solurbis]